MKPSLPGIAAVLLFFTPLSLFAEIDLYKKNKLKLQLGADLAVHCIANFREDNAGFLIDAAKVKLISEYKGKLKFYLSVDPSKPNSSSKNYYSEPLDKVYLQYKKSKRFKIRVGQFKAPFGNEMMYGIEDRTLVYHRITSKKICPDLDRGIMLFGKEVYGMLGYNIGIFNGTSVEQSLSIASGQAPLKLYIKRKIRKKHDFMVGYNALYRVEIPYSNQWEHRFADGYFLDMQLLPAKGNKLTILAEYLERLDFRHFGESSRNWERGAFLITALRIKRIEPVLYFEIYDQEALFKDDNDIIQYGFGINSYFFKDNFRLRFDSQFENHYQTDFFNSMVTLGVQGHI